MVLLLESILYNPPYRDLAMKAYLPFTLSYDNTVIRILPFSQIWHILSP
jgi:hypothetical protein